MSDDRPAGLAPHEDHYNDDAMGLVEARADATQMAMNCKPGWMAHLDTDDVEAATVSAATDGYDRRVKLAVEAEPTDSGYYWVHTQLTPQAALRLVEQLLTATQHALAEDRWLPEYGPSRFDYDLGIVEPTDTESDTESDTEDTDHE